jgi:hypothetical protein
MLFLLSGSVQCAPRLTGGHAKEKEEKEIKAASLSLHFELHETR